MRTYKTNGGWYFASNLTTNKVLEVGYQFESESDFDVYFRFRTRGDHAGLTFHINLGRFFFELAIHDVRHYNWDENRFYEPGEEQLPSNDNSIETNKETDK